MRLVKPEFVNHDGNPIFSIDIHPDGTRFTTGGQGSDGTGQVVIWNLLPVIDETAEKSSGITQKLCQMDNHLACVNSVRWSGNGLTLASAGDDKIIMLWKRGIGPSTVFGSSGISKSVENWRCQTILRGHSGDILDVAWSPQDRYLASSSVDNTIIVWCMNNLQTITTLKGHSGLVKGVAWDPVGAFLASQSDDRTVRVWRTKDWGCQKVISEPFEECGGTTHVLRLSWSPDGLYLVSAHAMNGGGPTAQIIERNGWKCDKDFVGHRKAVNCVRFNQSILQRKDSSKKMQYCCLAIGSRDRSVSIWCTTYKRPLAVVKDLFSDSILDLSWGQIKDQTILLACSTDGTIAALLLSEDEIGKSLSAEDKNSVFQREYGKCIDLNLSESSMDKGIVPEYSELLNVEESNKSAEANVLNNNNITNNNVPNNKSTPQFGDIEMDSVPISTKPAIPQNTTPVKAIEKQIETRRADGKRRITPMFVPISVEQDSNELAKEATSVVGSAGNISNTAALEKKMNEQMSKGSVVFDSAIIDSSVADTSTNTIAISNEASVQKSPPIRINTAQLDNRLTKVPPARATITTVPVKESGDIDEPALRRTIIKNVSAGKSVPYTKIELKVYNEFQVKIQNSFTSTSAGPICKVIGFVLNKPTWETYIGSPVVNFCLCAKYVLICSKDSTIRFLEIQNGIAVLPILQMPSPVIQCVFSINSDLGGVVTECGQIRVWNLNEGSIYITATCHDLFPSTSTLKPVVSYFHVTEAGILYIMLSNGCAYSYSKNLESWITLNSRDPIIRLGISTLPHNPYKTMKKYPLGLIQSTTQLQQPNLPNLQDSINTSWKHTARLSFIENQIETSKAIQSPMELEHWYSVLGVHLSMHGDEKRIRSHLDDLLGTPNSLMVVDEDEPIKEKILGIEKHKLLSCVLDHLKQIPRWQRIYIEYSQQLKDLNI
ncbi:protein HIRA homolog [Sitodiplosis mosellana]|uniref:protein HIRA homolog n=1 Tax=Sitodiplosis mosellana TaxID=263140 RepID=UPI002444DA71|nr:protein HIRA homolog [Sitodiplosis mosellana]